MRSLYIYDCVHFITLTLFLDASSHLYNRVCPSVGRSVGWSVGRSVTLS